VLSVRVTAAADTGLLATLLAVEFFGPTGGEGEREGEGEGEGEGEVDCRRGHRLRGREYLRRLRRRR
jgi:hypothetical protein